MTSWRAAVMCVGLAGLGSLLAGCATVQPWERARLADPCMVFDANGAQAVDRVFDGPIPLFVVPRSGRRSVLSAFEPMR